MADGWVADGCALTGVGFAIGIDTVRRVVPQLIATGKVVRPALNIQVPESSGFSIYHDITLLCIAPAKACLQLRCIYLPCALRAPA